MTTEHPVPGHFLQQLPAAPCSPDSVAHLHIIPHDVRVVEPLRGQHLEVIPVHEVGTTHSVTTPAHGASYGVIPATGQQSQVQHTGAMRSVLAMRLQWSGAVLACWCARSVIAGLCSVQAYRQVLLYTPCGSIPTAGCPLCQRRPTTSLLLHSAAAAAGLVPPSFNHLLPAAKPC